MEYYNSQHFFHILFSLRHSDTLKKLVPILAATAGYALMVYLVEVHLLNLNQESALKNISLFNTLLGFVLSLLLVFRTNSAYDRWWEGRKLWGQLVNDSRNLAIKFNSFLKEEDADRRKFFHTHLAYFPHALSEHLTKQSTIMALDRDYSLATEKDYRHAPMEIVDQMSRELQNMLKQGEITVEERLILDSQLANLLNICGGCERIKNTPIPHSYSSFVKKFIITYVLILPLGHTLTAGWLMIPLTMFICYVLLSLELIAEEIEDPFGTDENDLPTEKMAQNIEKNIDLIF